VPRGARDRPIRETTTAQHSVLPPVVWQPGWSANRSCVKINPDHNLRPLPVLTRTLLFFAF
jgi:hypothetical protein